MFDPHQGKVSGPCGMETSVTERGVTTACLAPSFPPFQSRDRWSQKDSHLTPRRAQARARRRSRAAARTWRPAAITEEISMRVPARGWGGLIAARYSTVDSIRFPWMFTARGTSSSLWFAGSRPRHDLMCGRREKPATSLRLIPRVECQRLRSLDHRELIRAVKSCTTGPVQRRCQWKRIHHPQCCHLLSWWTAGVSVGMSLNLVWTNTPSD